MAKMIMPTDCFYYKAENISMSPKVPVTLKSDDEADRLIAQGLAIEYEEVHPNGNFNITTNGEFDVKQYAQVTVNTEALVVVLVGGTEHDETYYMPFVKGQTRTLPTAEQYAEKWTVEEGMQLVGWTTVKNDVSTKVDDEISPNENMYLYALLEKIPEEEEEEEEP